MKRPTIKDIARQAGVTPATVSMALNHNGRISAETREKIQEIAKQLDYRPNPMARGLVRRRSNLVGVILVDVASSFFKDILRGLEEALQPEGYGILLNVTNGDPQREARFLEFQAGKAVDALILEPTMKFENQAIAADLVRRGVTVMTILHNTWGWGNLSVSVDNEAGARIATNYLLQRCKRVAHLRGPASAIEAEGRLEGYRAAVANHADSNARPLYVRSVENRSGLFDASEGYRQMKELLELPEGDRPDGIFAASDSLAIGAVQAIHEAGLHVPDNFEVVGFDDVELATICRPALTTVAQPKFELGHQAGLRVLQFLEQKEPSRDLLEPRLVVRSSTKPR